MRHALRRLAIVAATILALNVGAPVPPASAQMTVIDPTNLAQNLLQATRALEQINNQIRQIEQQASMLAQNPLQLSPELSQSIGQSRELFSTAQGLTFQVNQMSEQLRDLYPETWDDFDLDQIADRTQQWLREDRRAVERAMRAEARAAEVIDGTRDQVNRALQSSASAEGQTGVGQVTNQLLGINAAQLTEIHALLIAQSRALNTERMERLAREERALAVQRRAFPTQTNTTPTATRSAFEN
jgi:P-type conjugative transfer protein TrbJ